MLRPELSKDAERIRRRVMHFATRFINGGKDDDLKTMWHKRYKNIVNAALTEVLAEEVRETKEGDSND